VAYHSADGGAGILWMLAVWQYTDSGPDNDLHARRVAADGTISRDAPALSSSVAKYARNR